VAVDTGRLVRRRPRFTEHPVAQSLAAVAEPPQLIELNAG
jgi:hypothetical protein